jgi:hypothetical protein
LPNSDQSIVTRCDERLALDGEAYVPHAAAVTRFAVADFLNDVVGGAAVQ